VDTDIALVSPTGANVGKKYLNGTVVVAGGDFNQDMVADTESAPKKGNGDMVCATLLPEREREGSW
jgi:hypothetical protein